MGRHLVSTSACTRACRPVCVSKRSPGLFLGLGRVPTCTRVCSLARQRAREAASSQNSVCQKQRSARGERAHRPDVPFPGVVRHGDCAPLVVGSFQACADQPQGGWKMVGVRQCQGPLPPLPGTRTLVWLHWPCAYCHDVGGVHRSCRERRSGCCRQGGVRVSGQRCVRTERRPATGDAHGMTATTFAPAVPARAASAHSTPATARRLRKPISLREASRRQQQHSRAAEGSSRRHELTVFCWI
jgi:hypothetical protein